MTLTSALMACGALGLQHGFDWDHLAAVSDIATIQRGRMAAIRGGMLYSIGHAMTVGLLGMTGILLRHSLPGWMSMQLQVAVGISLIGLGGYIAVASARSASPCSRAEVLGELATKLFRRRVQRSAGASGSVGRSSVALGVLHGLGAETPTQLAVLVIAANLGRPWIGIAALGAFATSMFASNAALSGLAVGVVSTLGKWVRLTRIVRFATAMYSVAIGMGLTLEAFR